MLKHYRFLLLAFAMIACFIAPSVDAKQPVAKPKVATPAEQTLKIYQAIRDQNYEAMFYLLAFTAQGKTLLTTPEEFGRDARIGYNSGFKTPEEKEFSDRLLASISDIMVGEPTITGNKAVVSTSSKITINGQVYQFRGQANLIQDEGVWKLDLTTSENSETAMSQRIAELLGNPDKPK